MRRWRGTDVPPGKSAVVGFTGQCPFLVRRPRLRLSHAPCESTMRSEERQIIGQIAYVQGHRFVRRRAG